MKKISVRIAAIDLQVLKTLCKDRGRLSDTIRTILIKHLHANHEPIYQQIYAENRRRNNELLASYYARQAQEKTQTTKE